MIKLLKLQKCLLRITWVSFSKESTKPCFGLWAPLASWGRWWYSVWGKAAWPFLVQVVTVLVLLFNRVGPCQNYQNLKLSYLQHPSHPSSAFLKGILPWLQCKYLTHWVFLGKVRQFGNAVRTQGHYNGCACFLFQQCYCFKALQLLPWTKHLNPLGARWGREANGDSYMKLFWVTTDIWRMFLFLVDILIE